MFPSGGFALLSEHREALRPPDKKSHSGILGSKVACTYPRLIAACRALLRLSSLAIHQMAAARRVFPADACATMYGDHYAPKGGTTPFTLHSSCRVALTLDRVLLSLLNRTLFLRR